MHYRMGRLIACREKDQQTNKCYYFSRAAWHHIRFLMKILDYDRNANEYLNAMVFKYTKAKYRAEEGRSVEKLIFQYQLSLLQH